MDENSAGGKMVLWGSIGAEVLQVVYDLRHMILCAVALILADLWWGIPLPRKGGGTRSRLAMRR